MSRFELEQAAEDRLLEAALEEVLGAAPARVVAPVVVRSSRWFAAAILLLGCGVLFAVAMLVGARDGTFAQGPELPPPIKVEGRSALEKVDRTTQNLWCILMPRDLPLLSEFEGLRQLLLEEQEPTGNPAVPADAPSSWSLAPLARCVHLQSLTIGNLEGFDPKALAAVAQLPELRELKLIGTRHLVDAEFTGELHKLPIRSLSLLAVGIDAGGFTALCGLPLLERLELRSCLHLDRCDLMQLRHLRQLQSLALRGVGDRFADSLSKSHPLADEPRLELPPQSPAVGGLQMPGEQRLLLTPELMQALANLPGLRELNLAGSVVDDVVLAALPPQLTSLDLSGSILLGTKGLTAAPALANLRTFGFTDLDGSADAVWQFVRAHRLHEVSFHGRLSDPAVAGLSTQSGLRALELVLLGQQASLDVGFTSALPLLERLSVVHVPDFDPSPLTRLPHLRRVELHRAAAATVARVRQVLGDRVRVLAIDD